MDVIAYKLQKVFCVIIQVAVFIKSILYFRIYNKKTLKDDPEKFITLCYYLFGNIYLIVLFKLVWSNKVADLFRFPISNETRKV